jgi:hypothetical protein
MVKFDADDIFNKWKMLTDEDLGKERFTYKKRREALEDLSRMLFEAKISFEDSKLLLRKVKDFLVTIEGSKGSGKYKGWKENVESEYLGFLASIYSTLNTTPSDPTDPSLKNDSIDKNETTETPKEIELNPIIRKWGQVKFGLIWCRELEIIANTPTSSVHYDFLDEFFS